VQSTSPQTSARTAAALTVAVALIACASRGDEAVARPVVALVAHNAGTETTDFLIPYGILAMSESVELHALSTSAGPVALQPALHVELTETIDSFDADHPGGAQYVIVPAVAEPADPRLIGWLAAQARRGATLVAICDGVWPVAATGVLAGRRATAHWYSLDDLESTFPTTTWIYDQRYVRDGPVMTTTGVTASIPASLALLEAIAGAPRARVVAAELGIDNWSSAHDSRRFSLTARDVATAARNAVAFWHYERVGIPVAPGADEIGLALTADTLARTYRTTVFALSTSPEPVRLRHGMRLHPDLAADAAGVDRIEPLPGPDVPITAVLDGALSAIEHRHGVATADFVALQIEYPERRLRAAEARP
jgi:transcriptional regulator GlxA family with amidase domain